MNILLPIDGSTHSLQAVRHAVLLCAQGLKAHFVLANVQERASFYEVMTLPDPAALEEINQAAGHDALQAAEQILQDAHLTFDSEVVTGSPGNTLVEMVERLNCQAVIMSTHSMGSIRNALWGSVAHTVVQNCPVPVTLVP